MYKTIWRDEIQHKNFLEEKEVFNKSIFNDIFNF